MKETWFFDKNQPGLGFKYLIVGFNKHKEYRYPKLLVHVSRSHQAKAKTVSYDDFTFNDSYFKSNFILAVKSAYRAYIQHIYIPYSLKHQGNTRLLKAALCEKQFKEALKYVETEEFFERVHQEIVNKSKSLPNGLKDVIFSPFWMRQGKPMWVTFGAHKSSSKAPTIEIGYKADGVKISERRNISSYRDLYLWSAYYVAQLLTHNKEVFHESKTEYIMGIYYMLTGHWRKLCIDYKFEVEAEATHYRLDLTKWLERVNIEYGFLNKGQSLIECCKPNRNKPFNYTISDSPKSAGAREIMPRNQWLAIAHSFGDSGFTYNEINQVMIESGFICNEITVRSRITKDCQHIGYSPNTERPTRVYRAIANI